MRGSEFEKIVGKRIRNTLILASSLADHEEKKNKRSKSVRRDENRQGSEWNEGNTKDDQTQGVEGV